MRATRKSENNKKKIRSEKKSLKASLLLLWHAIVSDHFSSSFERAQKKSHQ
jgi:hypothetical protein